MTRVHTKQATFERIWSIAPAFDRRHPLPSKNYGIHGCELRMVLKGPLGATQFLLFTNWQLPHVQVELDLKPADGRFTHLFCHPQPADLGYHWLTPRHNEQSAMDCEYVPGGKCYYDGSGLNAERIYQVLLKEGSDGVWRELESYYHEIAKESVTDETRGTP